jgi:hypothetical protein
MKVVLSIGFGFIAFVKCLQERNRKEMELPGTLQLTSPGSALGSLPSVALSSDQDTIIIPDIFWYETKRADWLEVDDSAHRHIRRGTTQAPSMADHNTPSIATKRNVTLQPGFRACINTDRPTTLNKAKNCLDKWGHYKHTLKLRNDNSHVYHSALHMREPNYISDHL